MHRQLKNKISSIALAIVAIVAIPMLSACGGGGGVSDLPGEIPAPPAPQQISLSPSDSKYADSDRPIPGERSTYVITPTTRGNGTQVQIDEFTPYDHYGQTFQLTSHPYARMSVITSRSGKTLRETFTIRNSGDGVYMELVPDYAGAYTGYLRRLSDDQMVARDNRKPRDREYGGYRYR
jgi:hypothetical protein